MIELKINNRVYQFEEGTTLEEIVNKINLNDRDIIVAGIINNRICDLSKPVEESSTVKFVTINDEIGNRIYRRSLFLLLARSVYELYPKAKLSIEHSLSNGIYCEIHKDTPLSQVDLFKIKTKMKELVDKDLAIKRHLFNQNEVKGLYIKQNCLDKVALLEQIDTDNDSIYELDGYYDYFFYNMVPATGYLNRFGLHFRMPGFILLYPQKGNPYSISEFIDQPKLAKVFYEYEKWGEIIGVDYVSDLNQIILKDRSGELIRLTEALHEKKVARIADEITANLDRRRVILIAGPSSSGKTTFAQRLALQLKVNGLKPVAISTDNYFVNRDDTPLDEEDKPDFEAIEAIDLNLLNDHLVKLLQGIEVEVPIFNFRKGAREEKGRLFKIAKDQPIIIEGIHSLNDRLTSIIPEDNKFKIYISALTQLNLDCHNRIPTTDTRLIRRIVRDNKFRGHPASMTIDWWPGVRRGEEKNIFPYQENADVMFNSALIYELSVLKKYAEPLLNKITVDQESYYQAQRLLGFLRCFIAMPEDNIPRKSILKEFIGGSCFN